MTIINYFRDHFIEIINGNIEYGKKVNENNENNKYFSDKNDKKSEKFEKTESEDNHKNKNNNANGNDNENENENDNKIEIENEGEIMIEEIQKIISSLKIKRLCVRLSRIEVLVPLNSQGTDAICFAVPTARIFKFYEKSEKQFSMNFMNFNKNYYGGYKFVKNNENDYNDNYNNEINDDNCYDFNDNNNDYDNDCNNNNNEYNNSNERVDNEDNQNENENQNKKFNGNENRINFSTVSSCDSDTPGLSYFRGPLLSGNKRISEYENILKSVKNLNSNNLRNINSNENGNYFTENKSKKTDFNVDSSCGEEKDGENENDEIDGNEDNNNNNKHDDNNINWKLLNNIFEINKWDDMGIYNNYEDISESDNHNNNNINIINSSTNMNDIINVNNVNDNKIDNDVNNNKCNKDINKTQTLNTSSSSLSPLSSSPSTSNQFGLRVEIKNASISSWCNNNLICDDINILGALSIEKGIQFI